MTDAFSHITRNESELCKAIIEIMSLDMTEEEVRTLTLYRPFLSLVDNYISYYQSQEMATIQVPIFYMLGANDSMRKLLVKYLTVRLGIFNGQTLNCIYKDVKYIETYGHKVPSEWEPGFKAFNKKINYKGEKIRYGYALARLKKKVNSLSINHSEIERTGYNLLICKEQEVCDNRDSLLVDFFEQDYKHDKQLFVNSDLDANELKAKAKEFYKKNRDSICGNAYMVYYNSNRFKSFGKGRLEQISQLGFEIKNMFVFVLLDHPYSTGKVLSDKSRLERVFNVGKGYNLFFTLQYDEILQLNPENTTSEFKRLYTQTSDSDDILRNEIALMLEGTRYPTSKRNILSLCAGEASQNAFFELLTQEDPEYQRPEHPVIFSYIRKQWSTEILGEICYFLGHQTNSFALVVDGFTPQQIKDDICKMFEGYSVNFYKVSDLKLVKGENSIPETHIVVIRFMRFYKDSPVFPNSYDPYVLKPNQKLLEIINVPIFQNKLDVSNYELNAAYNKLLEIEYRKKVLGWKPISKNRPVSDGDAGFYMEYDSGDYTYSQNKLLIVTSDGKKRTIPESELLIVEEDGQLDLRRGSDILDEYDGLKMQLASDIENYLKPLIDQSASKDSSLEMDIRRQFIPEIGQSAITSKEELWRLLLEWEVIQKGEDVVYKEVIENAGISLKMNAFKNWYSFDYQMILPRDRQSMDSVLTYLGFEKYGTYYIIMRRKKIRQKNKTKNNNSLLDELLSELFKYAVGETTFKEMEAAIPDSMDLLGIDSEDYLQMVRDDIFNKLSLKEIKQVKRYGE